jgi:Flp pilus assembly pilin Flp
MTEIRRKTAKRSSHLRRLLADESGVTAIEFGILALPFFSIIAAIMQTAVIFLSGQVLESALNDAARSVRTGQLQLSGGTIETFRESICDRLYGLFPDCEGLHIRLVEVDNFQSATVAPPVETDCDGPCEWTENETFTPGQGRSVILAQVHYRYPVLIPLGPVGMSNLPDGTHLMASVAVFQNEPFS